MTGTRLSNVTLKLALGIAWTGRLLAIAFAVLGTVFAAYLTVWAWRLQPIVPGDTDAEYTAGIAIALGLLGVAFSAMATAARALPPWWLGMPLLLFVMALTRWAIL